MSGFDYIVVGAGSAGSLVTSALIRRGFAVLLLEAGAARIKQTHMRRPAEYLKSFGTAIDWNYTTVPQRHLANRSIAWPRGKGVGGSALLNAMIYLPAPANDFDAWAAAAGQAWSANALRPYQDKIETLFAQRLEPLRYVSPSTRIAIRAANAYFGRPTIQPHRVMCRGGRRQLPSDLLAERTSQARLQLRGDCFVQRVIFSGDRAIGVQLETGEVVRADRGVVLAAGALGSPRMLVSSGIGPAETLHALSIPLRCASEQVGCNLQDHPVWPIIWSLPERYRFASHFTRAERAAYEQLGRGRMVSNLAEASGLIDAPSDASWQLMITPTHYALHPRADAPSALTMAIVLAQPHSRGTLRFDAGQITIDPDYLSHPADHETLMHGIRVVREIAATDRFFGLQAEELLPGARRDSDASLDRVLRRTLLTLYHPVGTCRMGSDSDSVVDSQLRVRGTENLFVFDASIFPTLTSVNPHATILAVALRAAEEFL